MSTQPWTTPVAPMSPDFHVCDGDTYGKRLNRRNCLQVANLLPTGTAAADYMIGGGGPFGIPWQQQRGNCRISIEVAGPGSLPGQVLGASPDIFRGAAFYLIQQCVKNGGGVGGFATLSFQFMADFLTHPSANIFDTTTWTTGTSFTTVTIDGGGEDKKPGDNSPSVPATIARLMADKYSQGDSNQAHYGAGADWFLNKVHEVNAGYVPWWCPTCGFGDHLPDVQSQQHMIYECDASLGAPSSVDCSQLDYSQLGPPSDSVTIGPTAPKILASNTCDVAISSNKPITLRWSDIRLALEALVSLCVSNPLGSSIGGRTYYGSKPLSKKSLTSRADAYTLDSLPPGVNLTLYQPGHYAHPP